MNDRRSVSLSQGAEVFEYNGKACHKYNAKIKIAGDTAKVTFFQNGILCGYPKNTESEKEQVEYDPRIRFEKTGRSARARLHDVVKANLGKHRDFNGKKQSFKFLTLTFRNDVKDLATANKEFNLFIKRLNYAYTQEKGNSFLKYVSVSELQNENNRGVWHYHVLFFNMPYMPVSYDVVERLIAEGRLSHAYDKGRNIASLWGNGTVDLCSVKFNDTYDVAGYMSKYIGKGLDGSFDYALEYNLVFKKKFITSRGLLGPEVMIAFLNKEQRQQVFQYFKNHHKHFKKGGKIGGFFEHFTFENDYIGAVFGFDVRASIKSITDISQVFERCGYGFS
jgi:hypothetical protein